jgi:thiamine-phosphate pyrophosphorylase
MPQRRLLYYITDRNAFPGDESSRHLRLLEKIREAAVAGVDFIQLREKDLSTRELEFLAREAVKVITLLGSENQELRTSLLINSRTDVSLAVQADGVHLRSNDIFPQDVRAAWPQSGADPIIAVSCHSPAEVAQASANAATFAVFGPVFEKRGSHSAGLELLRESCQAKIPVVALGGVTLANAQSCLAAGAAGVAAIRLFQENDIASVVKRMLAMD